MKDSLMKTMIMILTMLIATSVMANTDPVIEFDSETCLLTVGPNANALDEGWFVCITDAQFIGIHNESEEVECGVRVDIGYDMTVDLSEYLWYCGTAIPTLKTHFGTLKSIYR
jgi:hypothetical protein